MREGSGTPVVVIGAGMAGLLAARVLHEHFSSVIILERDTLEEQPSPRRGVPQSFHPHILLARGLQCLQALFPDIEQDLKAAGARFKKSSVWRISTTGGVLLPVDIGHDGISVTRPVLEWIVRRQVSALPGVQILSGREARSLTYDPQHRAVTGIVVQAAHLQETSHISTALVVDASGRSSKCLRWLAAAGYPLPAEDRVKAGIGYSSRFYRIPNASALPWKNLLIQPHAPHNPGSGVLHEVEGGIWQVVLAGSAGHYPPKDEAGFMQWAAKLPDASIYEVIRQAEPVSPIWGFRIPKTHFRHFEQLSRWPAGLVVTGDAVCTFNPIYGQGMTVAALEALALREALKEKHKRGWEKRFQGQAARVIADAWRMGTSEDLRWSEVTLNDKTASWPARLMHRYMDRLLAAACHDPAVSKAFLNTIAMVTPPTAILHPKIALRVLLHSKRRNKPEDGIKG